MWLRKGRAAMQHVHDKRLLRTRDVSCCFSWVADIRHLTDTASLRTAQRV